jgi:hypothetical protein
MGRLAFALFVAAMFSFASRRLLVRAFSSSSSITTGRRTIGAAQRPFRFAQSFATRAEATVEEDLDAALDDILGDTIEEVESSSSNGIAIDATGTHIEGSHPIPKALVEKVRTLSYYMMLFDRSIQFFPLYLKYECLLTHSRSIITSCHYTFTLNHRMIRWTLMIRHSCLLPTPIGFKQDCRRT